MGSKTRNQDVVHELEKVSRAGRGMCHSAHTRSDSHPRNAGTYSRVLAQYVREKGTISLMDALRKMSLMPAEMLERSTPDARRKGRLQEGADADIVVFDAATISDRSTFAKPMEPSVGVRYLLVGGTVVVDEGKIVPDVFPGLALLGPGKRSVLHD
jgi:N-acyl-D-aspartate/D-glutamate deacylase